MGGWLSFDRILVLCLIFTSLSAVIASIGLVWNCSGLPARKDAIGNAVIERIHKIHGGPVTLRERERTIDTIKETFSIRMITHPLQYIFGDSDLAWARKCEANGKYLANNVDSRNNLHLTVGNLISDPDIVKAMTSQEELTSPNEILNQLVAATDLQTLRKVRDTFPDQFRLMVQFLRSDIGKEIVTSLTKGYTERVSIWAMLGMLFGMILAVFEDNVSQAVTSIGDWSTLLGALFGGWLAYVRILKARPPERNASCQFAREIFRCLI